MPKKKGKSSKFAFKLLLVGEPEVGKTSLIKRYVDDFFKEGYQITLGVDFLSKTVSMKDPKTGEDMMLGARMVVTFRCSPVLKDKLNDKR